MAKSNKKSVAAKSAKPVVVAREGSSVTSSEGRQAIWNAMLKNPKMARADLNALAERHGLKPAAINFAVKYFRQITSHLITAGKMKPLV